MHININTCAKFEAITLTKFYVAFIKLDCSIYIQYETAQRISFSLLQLSF